MTNDQWEIEGVGHWSSGLQVMLKKLLPPIALAIAVGLPPAGCIRRTVQEYVPDEQTARTALDKAMKSWQRGEPPGRIDGQPPIQVGDTHRRPGQKLAGYEIVGQLPSDEGRLFAVRVQLENPAAEEKINFLVVGIDPLWVWRQEDYQMVTHWEHNMEPPPAARQQGTE